MQFDELAIGNLTEGKKGERRVKELIAILGLLS